MDKFKIVKTTDFTGVITRCYNADDKLIEHYHVLAPSTLDDCIRHTVDVFNNSPSFAMYKLYWENRFAGYFGVETTDIQTIKGFFLMPFFRAHKWDKVFFNTISSAIGPNAYTAVYDKNLRANKFLMRNNCTFVIQLFDDKEMQVFNIYKICHLEDY